MKRFLYTFYLFLSRIGALLFQTRELYHARFARVHELDNLLTDSLPSESLLLGINSNFNAFSTSEQPQSDESWVTSW